MIIPLSSCGLSVRYASQLLLNVIRLSNKKHRGPNAVLAIHNHEIKMSFTCVPVSFFGRFRSDLNQSEGGLRCEFQMLTGLS